MRIIVINLERAKDRRERLQKRFDELGLEVEFLPALDVKTISKSDIRRQARQWPSKVSGKDVACRVSHMKAWQEMMMDEGPAMICEDDILVSRKLPQILADIETHIRDGQIYDLEAVPRKHVLAREPAWEGKQSGHTASKIYQNKNGAAAYVLNPQTARELFKAAFPKFVLIDVFMWSQGWAQTFQVEPAAAVQDVYAGDFFENRKKMFANEDSERIHGRSRWNPGARIQRLGMAVSSLPAFLLGKIFGEARELSVAQEDFDLNQESQK